ncbi:MAG: SurA N-terminal domain-containing protein [Gammaproteobacteria bacterium]|nr:SurA N-terminal domain-containing protein [Gammaproteobacteria bacterium]
MMESIRTGVQKPWIKVLLGVVIISFIFAGYFTGGIGGPSPDAVAKVNGEEIKINDWNNAVALEANRYGEQFDALFPTDERKAQFRKDVLDKLINSRLVAQYVKDLGFTASEQQVVEQVMDIESFKVDGNFSTELLDQALRSRGWSREKFRAMVGEDIANAQFIQVFSDTQLATNDEAIKRLKLEKQTRDVRSLTIPAKQFLESVELTEEDIEQYYQANLNEYQQPESMTVDYIELSLPDLMSTVEVSDAEVEEYYQGNIDLYRAEEQRRVAHILITTEGRSEEEAKQKLESLAKQLEEGAEFAELAKAESDDFSAADGGDLGFVGKGVMDDAFEEAMFSLAAVGDVSDIVKTEFGLHLIKLLEVKDGDARPLAEVKDDIVNRIKRNKAEEAFFLKKTKMKELAFQNYDSLSAAAAEANVEIKTSEPFPPSGGAGIFANPAVSQAAYSDQVMIEKRNSDAIDISDEQLVVLRMNTHTPARTLSLEEVKAKVSSALRQEKATAEAQSQGQAIIASLQNGGTVQDKVVELGLEWKNATNIRRNSSDLGFEITKIAFKAPKPTSDKAVALGEKLLNGDYVVLEVSKVTEPDSSSFTEAELTQSKARIQRAYQDSGYAALVDAARENADVIIYEDKVE